MIYAKTLNPEHFDYRVYEDLVAENTDIIIDGGRDFQSFNKDLLKSIKTLCKDYEGYDYEFYYHNSIKDFVEDILPKKDNGKKFSPKELALIKKTLNTDARWYSEWEERVIVVVLSILKSKQYEITGLRGYCQGDYVTCYHPKDYSQKEIDWFEAWYFGTGTEILIHDGDSEVISVDDIEGYSIYTASWKDEDIKRDIQDAVGSSEEVKLWKYSGTKTIKIDEYEIAG